MGLFDDVFYPDNDKREARAKELAQDLSVFSEENAKLAPLIEAGINNLNQKFRDQAKSLKKEAPKMEKIDLGEGVVISVIKAYSPVFMIPASFKASQVMAIAYLRSTGRIGEAAFARLVGLPPWLKVGKIAGGIGFFVAFDMILSSISGAITRDHLQDAISKLVPPRYELKTALNYNELLYSNLKALNDKLELLEQLNLPEKYDITVQKQLQAFEAEAKTITFESVKKELADRDRKRGSWTNEDPPLAVPATHASPMLLVPEVSLAT